ncbi:ABC-F family ATP-binding cassette domain-containing protein [Haematospirillum sp. H1815]|uniref:ABC-F family ATP-binding cassette domain-containing protein n=1 Tax=Haematospirillum sp. H1815 TaxID=2723108 RepID=UPI00143A4EB4|nr:ABC-F family ATP-binding cassette domain-containing protein [Haematospirillum sp. H1815]NKD76793.1 ABC-F family ATP-binding cassette domain-containing protein [Haematospirillum sp. H1815]
MLHLNSVLFRLGGRVLLDGASAHIPAGARVGLVGRNGTGKSTLIKLITGDLAPDGGEIRTRSRARIGYLRQEASESTGLLIDTVLAADTERSALLQRLEQDPPPGELADIHERLNAIDAHSAPARAARILSGLGFPATDHERPVQDYSGGWRMRVALAAVLFSRPDLLLLDEPTNHLDLEATLWLQSYLAQWPGTLVVISHDRDLLNQVPNRILHLENRILTSYGGNYDTFEKTRREKLDLQVKGNAKLLEQRKKMEGFIARFRAKASKARQAQSRMKMLEKMDLPVSVVEERTIVLDFPDPEPLPPPMIAINDASVGYGGKTVLRDISLRLDMDDRIALLGANGNGKSTLAKLLTGRLDPMSGTVQRSSKLRIGYFAQHQTDELNPEDTPLGHMTRAMTPKGGSAPPESRVRAFLGRFGFGVDHATTRVAKLSGGEKARLLIALMCREQPHLIVLDEPTNHLDIDTRDSLMSALNAFGGAVVLIAHDTHLVEACADRLWLVADGQVQPFDGDMADYRQWLLDRARDDRRGSTGKTGNDDADKTRTGSATNRREDRRLAAQIRARLAPLRQRVERCEQQVTRLNARRDDLEAKLADPALYSGPDDKVAALRMELGAVGRDIQVAEERWLKAVEELEKASAREQA